MQRWPKKFYVYRRTGTVVSGSFHFSLPGTQSCSAEAAVVVWPSLVTKGHDSFSWFIFIRYFLFLKQVTLHFPEQRLLCGCVGSCLFLPRCWCFSCLPGEATSALVPVAAFAVSSSCLRWERGERKSLEGKSWEDSLGQFWPWAGWVLLT